MAPPELPPIVTTCWSVLLGAWTRALGPHLAALLDMTPSRPPGEIERSHAIAIVTMSAFAIESGAARLRVSGQWRPTGGRPADSPIPFLRDGLPKFSRRLLASTEELFAVRNAVAHNHIWEMRGTWKDERFVAEAVQALSGRPKAALLTPDGRLTKRHRLNMVPELVGYEDARKTVRILVRVLDALAQLDLRNMPSAADTTRILLSNGRIPRLRAFHDMTRRRPR